MCACVRARYKHFGSYNFLKAFVNWGPALGPCFTVRESKRHGKQKTCVDCNFLNAQKNEAGSV